MAKNDYQARLKAREMAILRAGIEIGRQQMCDYISLAAHDQKIMGRALSAESINRMLNGCASKMEGYGCIAALYEAASKAHTVKRMAALTKLLAISTPISFMAGLANTTTV